MKKKRRIRREEKEEIGMKDESRRGEFKHKWEERWSKFMNLHQLRATSFCVCFAQTRNEVHEFSQFSTNSRFSGLLDKICRRNATMCK